MARIFHATLLVSVVLYVPLGEIMIVHRQRNTTQLEWVVLFVAAGDLAIAGYFRRGARLAREALELRPDDAGALLSWKRATLVPLVLCESIALLGFFLRVMGSSLSHAAFFYTLSFLFMLLWAPRPANRRIR